VILPGVWEKRSQIDSPLPSSFHAPSIWYDAVAVPHTKFFGKSKWTFLSNPFGKNYIEKTPGWNSRVIACARRIIAVACNIRFGRDSPDLRPRKRRVPNRGGGKPATGKARLFFDAGNYNTLHELTLREKEHQCR